METNKKIYLLLVLPLLFASFFLSANQAAASPNPTALSLSAINYMQDYVEIWFMNGDPNSNLTLYFTAYDYNAQSRIVGTTDSRGNLLVRVSTAALGIVHNSPVYAQTGDANGLRSDTSTWPYSGYSSAPLFLSTTSVSVEQAESVNVYFAGGGEYFLKFPDDRHDHASLDIKGSYATVTGLMGFTGSTDNFIICKIGGNCNALFVNVLPNSAPLTFKPGDYINLTIGDSTTTSLSGKGGYYISKNSNPSTATAYIDGSSLISTAVGGGQTGITVCQNGGQCGIVYVNGFDKIVPPTFSPASIALKVGESGTVYINGYRQNNGNFTISNNTNPSVASASIGNINAITVFGLNIGSSNITVCQPSGECSSFYVNVIAVSNYYPFTFVPRSLNLTVGGSGVVTINGYIPFGGSGYFISNNTAPAVASASINGFNINVTGLSAGTTNITFCQAINECSEFPVYVTAGTAVLNSQTPASSDTSIIKNLIKLASHPGVYLLVNGEKKLFSNRAVYSNWYGNDFSGLRTITQAEFDSIPYGKNLTIKTGNYFKFDNSENIYLVKEGNTICKTNNYTVATYLIQSSFIGDYQGFGNCQ